MSDGPAFDRVVLDTATFEGIETEIRQLQEARMAKQNELEEARVVHEEARALELPPHDRTAGVDVGDRIIVLVGDQYGWTGVVQELDFAMQAVNCRMSRADGSSAGLVWQLEECLAKLLDSVPAFSSLQEAESWLTLHDRKRRQLYATGSVVRFTWYAVEAGYDPAVGFAHKRTVDVECTGKVVGFMPWYAATPGYKILASLYGDPKILDVDATQIHGLV